WRSGAGIMIPAASDAPVPSVLMPGISVREFADSREPTTNTVAVRLLVRFEYRDVFDNLISDEAVFLGMAHRLNNVYEQGGNMAWSADLSLERSGPTTLFSPEQQREKRDAN